MTRYSYAIHLPYGKQVVNADGNQANRLVRFLHKSWRDAYVDEDYEHRKMVGSWFAQRVVRRVRRAYGGADPWGIADAIPFMD